MAGPYARPVLTHRNQDFLLRQIHAFAAGILRALGKRDTAAEEEELDAQEDDTETWLGLPIDHVVSMELSALMDLLAGRGEQEPAQLLVLGLILARRHQSAAPAQSRDSLRWKAVGLITRAIEAKPELLTSEVSEVLSALVAMQ